MSESKVNQNDQMIKNESKKIGEALRNAGFKAIAVGSTDKDKKGAEDIKQNHKGEGNKAKV